MGPTAVGKSSVAEFLCKNLNAELISVDSSQIYRGMNIGTAKPDQEILDRVPHYLIDLCELTESYSAAMFRDDALSLIEDIVARGKIPILAGGTMFYFSALENGLSILPQANPEVREELEQLVEEMGLEYLYEMLADIDPASAERINSQDAQRLKRALEIYRVTGEPASLLMTESSPEGLQVQYRKIALFCSRSVLHERIKKRFLDMIENGLVNEVETLVQKLEKPEKLPSMRSVGYRQVLDYLKGQSTHSEMIEKSIAATRQLAKRQLTWLRNQSNVVWVNAELKNSEKAILEYLQSSNVFGADGKARSNWQ